MVVVCEENDPDTVGFDADSTTEEASKLLKPLVEMVVWKMGEVVAAGAG
jgi:hypothetical protein